MDGTRLLSRTLASLSKARKILVAVSAIGFYANGGEETVNEESEPGTGFLESDPFVESDPEHPPFRLKGPRSRLFIGLSWQSLIV